MAIKLQGPKLEDDAKERVSLMIEHRVPWLALGLIGGIIATILSSQFEEILSKNIRLAFFIPVIVYMADALGTQTQSVYIRNLGRENVKFSKYLFKELLLGLAMGAIFGIGITLFTFIWFKSPSTALTVGLAMFVSMSLAPAIALIVPAILQKEHTDPAIGAGPFTTVVQDLISLIIYFSIASIIIFGV